MNQFYDPLTFFEHRSPYPAKGAPLPVIGGPMDGQERAFDGVIFECYKLDENPIHPDDDYIVHYLTHRYQLGFSFEAARFIYYYKGTTDTNQ